MSISPAPFKVGIVGAGAMGTLFGARLAASGGEVHIVVRSEPLAVEIRRNGLRVTSEIAGGAATASPASVSSHPQARACDMAMVMVKSNDTAGAVPALLGLIGPETLVLTLQNGLGNAETLIHGGIDPDRLLCGVTTQGASLVAPGHARHAGGGETLIGAFGESGQTCGAPARARAMLGALNAAGFQVRWCDPIAPWIWAKLVINAAINPATAILGVPNGALLGSTEVHRLMRDAIAEACAVAAASGVVLPYSDPWAQVLSVIRATATNRSSMLQDVDRGRPTEILAICGEIKRRGALLGVPTPVNACLAALVGALRRPVLPRF